MNFLRLHWFDVGIGLAVAAVVYVSVRPMDGLSMLLWISLITLFFHQFEEYRFPGYFPGMMNTVMFGSRQPDRYPLNTNTAMLINVCVGWLTYFLAALLGARAMWLGIATILVSLGNVVAHVFLFNIRGRTRYNPGMLTAIVLFAPVAYVYAELVIRWNMASWVDWVVGVTLGIVLNAIGILKMIDWLKDRRTHFVFPERFLLPPATEPAAVLADANL